jgi:5-methylcytosine-specific restriction endonuclease McrA
MQRYARSHFSDHALIQSALTNAGHERSSTADLIADIAEIDERRLYAPAGYPSTRAWCVGKLGLSDDAALRRITAARTARRFPGIFTALADGRLHLTAVGLLAPHLTEDTARELLRSAVHKSKSEIERLLAERFPKTDLLAWVEDLPTGAGSPGEFVPERVEKLLEPSAGRAGRSCVKPLSADSFGVQFTQCRRAHDKLETIRELLSHEIPSRDLADVVEALCDIADPILRKRRYAATEKQRLGHRCPAAGSRHIPDEVRRAVWERDDGCCTFVSEDGHRCGSRRLVEYDHIEAFARGGEATVDNVRLLCRAHNHYEAERTYGAEFMRHKRIAAAEARAEAKAREKKVREEEAAAARAKAAEEQAHELEVVPYLRVLGYNARESREAAAQCRDMRDAPIDERVRVALSYFRLRGTKVAAGALSQAAAPASVAAGP